MKAQVTESPEGTFAAYCEKCERGYESYGWTGANNWAAIHNELFHMPPIGGTR